MDEYEEGAGAWEGEENTKGALSKEKKKKKKKVKLNKCFLLSNHIHSSTH